MQSSAVAVYLVTRVGLLIAETLHSETSDLHSFKLFCFQNLELYWNLLLTLFYIHHVSTEDRQKMSLK